MVRIALQATQATYKTDKLPHFLSLKQALRGHRNPK